MLTCHCLLVHCRSLEPCEAKHFEMDSDGVEDMEQNDNYNQADMVSSSCATKELLQGLQLGIYYEKFIDRGWDDVEYLMVITPDGLSDVAQSVNMKKGHALKFVDLMSKKKRGQLTLPLQFPYSKNVLTTSEICSSKEKNEIAAEPTMTPLSSTHLLLRGLLNDDQKQAHQSGFCDGVEVDAQAHIKPLKIAATRFYKCMHCPLKSGHIGLCESLLDGKMRKRSGVDVSRLQCKRRALQKQSVPPAAIKGILAETADVNADVAAPCVTGTSKVSKIPFWDLNYTSDSDSD